jgi:hypothetical protein
MLAGARIADHVCIIHYDAGIRGPLSIILKRMSQAVQVLGELAILGCGTQDLAAAHRYRRAADAAETAAEVPAAQAAEVQRQAKGPHPGSRCACRPARESSPAPRRSTCPRLST